MASVPTHPLLTCVTELIRLSREGNLISLEAYGHMVDIMQHIRGTLSGGGILPLTAEDDAQLNAAIEELACELGVQAELQQQVEEFRLRPRPDEPTPPGGVVLPASGILMTLLLNMLTKWLANPAMQAKILEWIISLFGGGGGTTMPSTEAE